MVSLSMRNATLEIEGHWKIVLFNLLFRLFFWGGGIVYKKILKISVNFA